MKNLRFLVLVVGSFQILGGGTSRANVVGTVFSGATDGDAAAIWWNPAAMSRARSRLELVGNLTILAARYDRAGVDGQTGKPFPSVSLVGTRPEPLLGLVLDKVAGGWLRLGIAALAPVAEGASWPEKVTVDGREVLGPTRYYVTDAVIFHFFLQIAASFRIHRAISLGVAVNLVTSSLDFTKHLDLLNQDPLRDGVPCRDNPLGCENEGFSARTNTSAVGFSAGASVGVLVTPIPQLRIGLGYVSPVKTTLNGTITIDTARFEEFARHYFPGVRAINANGQGHIDLSVPQRVHAQVAVDVLPQLELAAAFQWINRSADSVNDVRITQRASTLLPEGVSSVGVHRDNYLVSLRAVGVIKQRWKIGFAVEYGSEQTAAEFTTPSNVGFHRIGLKLGAGVRLKPNLGLGFTFNHTILLDRTVESSSYANDRPIPYNTPDPSGRYSVTADRVGLDVAYSF